MTQNNEIKDREVLNNKLKIFLSYVHENIDDIKKLRNALEYYNIEVWQDIDITPGKRWKEEIRKGIQKGNFFMACFSNEYYQKEKTFMNEELTIAIEELRLRPTDRVWFIPIMLNDCQMPERSISASEQLSDIQAIKLFENWDKGIARIVNMIFQYKINTHQKIIKNHSTNSHINEDKSVTTEIYPFIRGEEMWQQIHDPYRVREEIRLMIYRRIKTINPKFKIRIIIDDLKKQGINFNFGPSYPHDQIENFLSQILPIIDEENKRSRHDQKQFYIFLKGKNMPQGSAYAEVYFYDSPSTLIDPIIKFKSEIAFIVPDRKNLI